MSFDTALEALWSVAKVQFPTEFVLDGDETVYIGVLDKHEKQQKLGDGGYAIDADGNLEAWKDQFETPPKHGQKLNCEGRRYVIASIAEDSKTYLLRINGINQ